ncbi:hypothetical protein ILYODFUR_031089, partial [Ilyodon furcidens]
KCWYCKATVGSTVALQQEGCGVRLLAGGLSALSLHVLPVHAWVLTGYSGFLPQSKNMNVRLIGLIQLPVGVNKCVHGCLPCVCLCCPMVDWQPVQGVPCLTPVDC